MATPMETASAVGHGVTAVLSVIEKSVKKMSEQGENKNKKKISEYDERIKSANEEQARLNRELEASIESSNKHHGVAQEHMIKAGQMQANMMKGLGAATANLYNDLGYFQNINGNQGPRFREVGYVSANQQMYTAGRQSQFGDMNPTNGINRGPISQPPQQVPVQIGNINPSNGLNAGPTSQPPHQVPVQIGNINPSNGVNAGPTSQPPHQVPVQIGHMNPENGVNCGPTSQPPQHVPGCFTCGSSPKTAICTHSFCPKCHVNDGKVKCPVCEKIF